MRFILIKYGTTYLIEPQSYDIPSSVILFPHFCSFIISGGYGFVSFQTHKKRYGELTHRLAYMKAKNRRELPRGEQVSHLCHNAHCVKAEHLVLESPRKNNNRKRCLNSTVCSKNHNGPNCLLEFKIYPK